MNDVNLIQVDFNDLKEGEYYLVNCILSSPPYKVCEFNGKYLTLAHINKKVKESEIDQIYLITNY